MPHCLHVVANAVQSFSTTPPEELNPKMPANKRQIPLPDGRTVEGAVIRFQDAGEHWNEYLVDDGTVIRVKLVATEIVKVEGEWDQLGNPLYIVGSTNLAVVSSPDHLKRNGGS